MKNNRKRRIWLLSCMMLMLFLMNISAGAAETKRLFNMLVSDGKATQTIKIYEVREGNKLRIGQKVDKPVTINIGSASASVVIRNKTKYYKATYQTLRYAPSMTLVKSAARKPFYLVTKEGKERVFYLRFRKPAKPVINGITPDKNTISREKDQMKIAVDLTSELAVTAELKIQGGDGKTIYSTKKKLPAGASIYTVTWNGKPSENNPAQLSTDACVPAESYTITVMLKYKYGKETKKVKATENIAVVETAAEANKANHAWSYVNWGWTMLVSGNEKLDYVAEVICREVLKPNMSQVERARALYNWIAGHYSYHRGMPEGYLAGYPAKIDVTSSKAQKRMAEFGKCVTALLEEGKAKKVTLNSYLEQAPTYWAPWGTNGMIHQVGDCCIIATCYSILLRHAGIEADLLEHGVQGGASHHYYNIIKIGGRYYMADVDVAVEGGGNNLGYAYFLRGTAFAQTQPLYTSASLNSRTINHTLYKKLSSSDCPGREG